MARKNAKQDLQKREELEEEAKSLDDQALVDAVLEGSEDLLNGEQEAFEGMAKQIGRPFSPKPLSELQRGWLIKAFIRVRWQQAERKPVELTPAQRAEFKKLPKFPWEMNLPRKPPGMT